MHFSTSASIFLSFSNITCTRGSGEAVRGANLPLIIQEGETLCCCACRLHCTTKLGVFCGELHVHRADVCMCRIPSHPHVLALHIHHPSMPHPLTPSPPHSLSPLNSSLPSTSQLFTHLLTAPHNPSATHCHNPAQPLTPSPSAQCGCPPSAGLPRGGGTSGPVPPGAAHRWRPAPGGASPLLRAH